jgi:anti-sigma factor RsiW
VNCQAAEPWLSAFLDGEVAASEQDALSAHIDDCDACTRRLAELRGLSWLLAAPVAGDPGFLVRFRERRDRERSGWAVEGAWRWLAVRLLPVALAALLAAGAAVMATIETDEPWVEFEARALGDGFLGSGDEVAGAEPVLQIAIQPFPGNDR